VAARHAHGIWPGVAAADMSRGKQLGLGGPHRLHAVVAGGSVLVGALHDYDVEVAPATTILYYINV
jgi:hypothetical protein